MDVKQPEVKFLKSPANETCILYLANVMRIRFSEIMACSGAAAGVADEQISAVLYWFVHWTSEQRDSFLENLLCKAVPNKLFTVVEAMNKLAMSNSDQSMFNCQLRLFDGWFRGWRDDQRNYFLHQLEHIDAPFVERLNNRVTATCGQL